jgi:hypothetical protein
MRPSSSEQAAISSAVMRRYGYSSTPCARARATRGSATAGATVYTYVARCTGHTVFLGGFARLPDFGAAAGASAAIAVDALILST